MNVCHVTSVHTRIDTRIFQKQCRSLNVAGHSVYLLVADSQGDEVIDGVSVIDVGLPKSRFSRVFITLPRICKLAIDLGADVYHLHDPELMVIALLLKKRGKVVIFDAHEDLPKQILNKAYIPAFVRKIVAKFSSLFEKFVCSRIDGVIAATPYIRDKFLRVNDNSIDINNFPIIGECDVGEAPWQSKEHYACYIGGIAKVRGFEEIVSAVGQCRAGVRLQVAGKVLDVGLDPTKLEGAVDYHGFLDREGVARVLDSSMVGLVTLHPVESYIDSLPVKLFEYMNAGIPVIASNFPGWVNIVEEANCGVCVDPLDDVAISRALDHFIANPRLAEEMGMNGRKAVATKYSWSNEERKLISFYAKF